MHYRLLIGLLIVLLNFDCEESCKRKEINKISFLLKGIKKTFEKKFSKQEKFPVLTKPNFFINCKFKLLGKPRASSVKLLVTLSNCKLVKCIGAMLRSFSQLALPAKGISIWILQWIDEDESLPNLIII
jgi:hypothetical protein